VILHYDLSHKLYQHFLDADLQYSCGYFADPQFSLDEAQAAKVQHIAGKFLLKPGMRVLDIGCGWGALALSLAKAANVEVVGVTLSCAQLVIAQQRARKAGLEHEVKFELQDYRQIRGKFDRIVSVGMFEHRHTILLAVSRLLADHGVALIHSIGRKDGPDVTSAWVRKHIFPGGYIPALSEVFRD
jgi:cyclopropane-fatty-acyl-phospholipid synthase